MPYLFTTPETSGHGSLRAAVGAVVAELHPQVHYFYSGMDITASELATRLWELVALQEQSAEEAEPITFARSTGATADDEFSIRRRNDAKIYIVTDDAVSEAGTSEAAVVWPEGSSPRHADPVALSPLHI